MPTYESMFILHPHLQEEQREEVLESFKALIIKKGGAVSDLNHWGMRKLATEIRKLKEGYYVVMIFSGDGNVVSDLERGFKLSDHVLRYIVTRINE